MALGECIRRRLPPATPHKHATTIDLCLPISLQVISRRKNSQSVIVDPLLSCFRICIAYMTRYLTVLSSFDHRNCFDPNVLLQHTCDPWEDCFPRYIHRTQLPMDFCRPFKHHLIFYSSHDPCTIQVDDPCSASLRYPCSYVPRKHTT